MKDFKQMKIDTKDKVEWLETRNDGFKGIIRLSFTGRSTIVISHGAGWDHVSVRPLNGSIPTWENMCYLKDLFWKEDEEVIQVHPARKNYVNNVDNCLHLWSCYYKDMVLPPSILVGLTQSVTEEQYISMVREAYKIAGEKSPV